VVITLNFETYRLWRRWVINFTLGELIGFGGIPVLGAAITLWLTGEMDTGSRSLLLYAVAILGGLGEGSVLGWFQSRVLREFLPGYQAKRWILATAVASAFAWACGMLAPTLDDVFGLAPTLQIAIWVPASLLILLSIGSAQAWVLRGLVERPQRWITANVLGWLAGLPWTFALPALVPESAAIAVWILTFVVAGVLMGLTAGAVTGLFLIRLNPIDDPVAGSKAIGPGRVNPPSC
jgi:hypothetical protein